MPKRKLSVEDLSTGTNGTGNKVMKTNDHLSMRTDDPVIQIVIGSYERVLHGITASISDSSFTKSSTSVTFADTFLFNAHASAIRCLALSPLPDADSAQSQGVLLASGGSDERVNVYSLSASPTLENDKLPPMPSLGPNKISENPRNRELGSIMQHSSSITALCFPTRSKLLSASEDNTIAISRTKDLTVVSTVKAPKPKAQGQPSGDTTPIGIIPAGINDFAIHPSMKLMVSVGKGEKCMRLWNLVTGKKAGVLNFDRNVLQSVKEGKYSSGEGRRIRWSPKGNEFAIAFERGAVAFGEDSKPRLRILPQPLTKLHQMCYLQLAETSEDSWLLMSTEDGRLLFFNTKEPTQIANADGPDVRTLQEAHAVAQLGGKAVNLSGRIKDFEIVRFGQSDSAVVTASSDGAIRIWRISLEDLVSNTTHQKNRLTEPKQIGILLGTYETGSRITCLKAFLMQPARPEEGLSEFEGLTEDDKELDSDNDSDSEQAQ